LNVLFDLDIDGGQTLPVMLRDYQVDNVERSFIHVDFQKIDLTRKVKVEVPIRLVGKAPGVKEGGILEHLRRELEVFCLPTAIPEAIEVDVSNLNIGDTIHLHEVKLPEGIELPTLSDLTIAAVVAPVEEKIEVPVEGAALAEPEVIGAKKPEEGEAAEAEAKPEGKKGK
jgi:large subunit ribosomal protein L25